MTLESREDRIKGIKEEIRKIKVDNPTVRYWQDLPIRDRNTYLALIELLDLAEKPTTKE